MIMVAQTKPRNMLPVSPMKMEAGLKLYGNEPEHRAQQRQAHDDAQGVPVGVDPAADHGQVNGDEQEPGGDDGGDAAAQAIKAVHQIGGIAASDDDGDHQSALSGTTSQSEAKCCGAHGPEDEAEPTLKIDRLISGRAGFDADAVGEQANGGEDLAGDLHPGRRPITSSHNPSRTMTSAPITMLKRTIGMRRRPARIEAVKHQILADHQPAEPAEKNRHAAQVSDRAGVHFPHAVGADR